MKKTKTMPISKRLDRLCYIKLTAFCCLIVGMLVLMGIAGAGDRGSLDIYRILIGVITDFAFMGLCCTIIRECESRRNSIIKRVMRQKAARRTEIVELPRSIA